MKLKSDKFKKKRGSYSRLLQIACRECGSSVCLYQKDGSGALRRMYVDRMFQPKVSVLGKSLTCHNGHILAMRIIYKKENRQAFRLFADSITKKIIKLSDC